MEKRALPHITAVVTMMAWGLTFVCTKILLRYMGPQDILLCRTILGFVALCIIRPHILRTTEKKHEFLFVATGATGVFGYYLAENTALVFADASFVAVAVSTAPLFTAALSFIILKEKGFGLRFIIGFVLAISGIALISFQNGVTHASLLGAALCLAAAVMWAVYSIVVKRLAELGYETIAVTKRSFAWGLCFMIVTRLFLREAFPVHALSEPLVIGNLAFLGLVASAACFVMWSYSVIHLGAAAASAYIYLQAPISVMWAIIILDEPLTFAIVAGFVLVVVGLSLSEGFDKHLLQRLRRDRAGN